MRNINFRLLPDTLGALAALVTLNVANNILERLPSTLPRIGDLQTLIVSGNSIVSLAILRLVQELANIYVPESEAWQARTEQFTRRNYNV